MTDNRVLIRVLRNDYQTIKTYCESIDLPIIRFVEYVAQFATEISPEGDM